MWLETERLYLRAIKADDLDALFSIYGDPATNLFNPAGPYPDINKASAVLAERLAHWEEHGFGIWAISLRTGPEKIIGFGGLSLMHCAGLPINNLGYRFATEAWGKGLATEFSVAAVKYGFTVLKLAEISAVVRAHHLASQKVLLKSGLRYTKEVCDVENAPASLLFTLSAEQWRNNLK